MELIHQFTIVVKISKAASKAFEATATCGAHSGTGSGSAADVAANQAQRSLLKKLIAAQAEVPAPAAPAAPAPAATPVPPPTNSSVFAPTHRMHSGKHAGQTCQFLEDLGIAEEDGLQRFRVRYEDGTEGVESVKFLFRIPQAVRSTPNGNSTAS